MEDVGAQRRCKPLKLANLFPEPGGYTPRGACLETRFGVPDLHIGVAGAHRFVELRLGEIQSRVPGTFVLCRARHQRRRRGGILTIQRHQPLAGFVPGHPEQVCFRGVEVLRIAWVADPHRLARAEHA